MRTLKLLIFVLAMGLASCGTTRTVPITGRQQSLLVDDAQMLSLSTQEYNKYMQTAKKSTNQANTRCCSTYDGEDLTGLVLLGGAYVSLVVDVLTNELKYFLVCKGVTVLILKACAVLVECAGTVLCVCNYA